MTAEFNWWLLLLGLVVGGGLTWLVLADTRRREQDLEDDELAEEAAWLEARMADEGRRLPADTLERVLQLHRAYLAIVPPDESSGEDWMVDHQPDDEAQPFGVPGEGTLPSSRHPSKDGVEPAPAKSSSRPPIT